MADGGVASISGGVCSSSWKIPVAHFTGSTLTTSLSRLCYTDLRSNATSRRSIDTVVSDTEEAQEDKGWRRDAVEEIVEMISSRKIYGEESLRRNLDRFLGKVTSSQAGIILQRLKDPNSAMSFYQWADSQQGFKHTTFSMNGLLGVLIRNRRCSQAYRFFRESLIQPNEYTYGGLIHGFCKSGDTEQAFHLLNEMIECGFTAAIPVHNGIIKGLCVGGKITEAMAHFRRMTIDCAPDIITYNTLIDALAKASRLDEANQILEEMRCAPNVITYSSIISGLCKTGKLEKAVELLGLMNENGCPPNVVTYNSLIEGLCKANRVDEAYHVMEEMMKRGCCADSIMYNTMLNGFCKAKKSDEALKLVEEMIEKGYPPNVITYNSLLELFCKIDQPHRSLQLLQHMSDRCDCAPDVINYNTVLAGLTRSPSLPSPSPSPSSSSPSPSPSPSSSSPSPLPSSSSPSPSPLLSPSSSSPSPSPSSSVDAARDLLAQMKSKCVAPDAVTYNIYAEILCKAGDAYGAYDVVRKMLDQRLLIDRVTYKMLAEGMCKSGDNEEVLKVLERLKRDYPDENVVTYAAFIYGRCAADVSACNRLLSWMCSEMGAVDDGVRFVNEMMTRGCTPDGVTYSTLIKGLSAGLRVDEGVKLFSAAKEMMSSVVGDECRDVLVSAYCSLERLQEAHELMVE